MAEWGLSGGGAWSEVAKKAKCAESHLAFWQMSVAPFFILATSRAWLHAPKHSVSVTDPNKNAPVLRIVEGLDLAPMYWEPLDAQGVERAVTVTYRPGTWENEQVYVVIRRDRDGQQELLQPAYTVILVSRDDLRVGELVRWHRAKQGQENAFNTDFHGANYT